MTDRKVLTLAKKRGETAKECIARYRREHPAFSDVSISHVGRIEPLSEGVVLALVGAENNHRSNYAALPEEHIFDVLFCFSTDTFDLLGKIVTFEPTVSVSTRDIEKALNEFRGKISQHEPVISSRTVLGKSIADWSRLFKPSTLPTHEGLVYEISLMRAYKAPEAGVLSFALEGIENTKGEYRQAEVTYLLKRYLSLSGARKFPAASIRIVSTPETSIRSIATGVGEFLGVPSVALRIVRTKVGEYGKALPRVS